jgi:hypothetical protein
MVPGDRVVMMDPLMSDLARVVEEVRSRLDKRRNLGQLPFPFDHFPRGCCGSVSEVLGRLLHERCAVDPLYVSGMRMGSDGRHITHAWLEVDDIIIDITADQFSRPPVIVTRNRTWHDIWEPQDRYPPRSPEQDPIWWNRFGWPVYDAMMACSDTVRLPQPGGE